ncbi:MAG: alpha/beta hydrolase [Rhodocyclaceae bacterium]|nr:alpha/beta hydrolase [Rhodocyclaceae bacterium]
MDRWTARGFVFVSINYPMVDNGANALAQAHHVAKAAAYVQRQAHDWGGDPKRLILMGHSAGAHLVSLVAADSRIRQSNGLGPLLGTVSLDSGALDVVTQMPRVYPFLKLRYQEAFGESEAEWVAASPFHRLDAASPPWLGVCSTTRKDDPCGQARAFADKALSLGRRAEILPQAKNHGAINSELGLENDYTRRVEAFMASLDAVVAGRLR